MATPLGDPINFIAPFPLDLRCFRTTIASRNAIETNARWEGMPVYVQETQSWWELIGGVTNDDWVERGTVTSNLQNVSWSTLAPNNMNGNQGDIWFRDNASTGNIDLYYKASEDLWGLLGSWAKEGGGEPESIPDNTLTLDETSATLTAKYPDMGIGGIAYNVDEGVSYTKKSPIKWTMEYFI